LANAFSVWQAATAYSSVAELELKFQALGPHQNRRQKVFNRGVWVCAGGLTL